MSELKAFTFGFGQYTENGSPCVVAFDGERNPRLASDEKFYLKSEADKVIADLKTERDEYRYNLSCARNEIHNMQAPMREDIKTIAELKADYKEACDRLQTANLIKDEQIAATRHQKYKRSLAMAELCEAMYDKEDAKVNGCGASWEYISKEMKYWERWQWRWLKIAEQFKEGV